MQATIIIIEVCVFLYYLQDTFAVTTKKFFEQSELLKALKLKSHRKRANYNHELPQYMLDLYNEITDVDGVTKRPLPYQSNIARAIKTIGDFQKELTFSTAGVPSDENIIEAEFHIHHHQLKNGQRKINLPHNMYKLMLYSETISAKPILVSTHDITNHAFGWRIFSVGEIVRKARSQGNNITFYFKVESEEGTELHLEIYHRSFGAKAPLLVLFNTNNNSSSSQLLFPNLVNDSGVQQGLNRKKREIFDDYNDNQIDRTVAKLDGCELAPMKVNFQDIGWASWIVYPTEYNAHQCIGGCAFPLGQDLDPTNHATVQSILHFSKTMDGVEHPSCVPISYTSLTLLYYDEDENVILKQFNHMIATSCGCR